jgi:glyoxylate/hydroxypyruvate reductase A
MKTIAFISRLEPNLQAQWVGLLQKKLVNEIILLPQQISNPQAKDVDIAIVANPDSKELARFPNLVWIQSVWAGVEKLIGAKLNNSVKLVRLIDPHLAESMAESVLAWALYLQRSMPTYTQQQINKQWNQLPSVNSKDLRVSVLGAGELGLAALSALSKLDYQLSCWSRTLKQVNGVKSYTSLSGLQSMLGNTDILINLLPLTQQTHHLLNKKLLSQLPRGAKLINFSRGAVVDTNALLELLNNNHLSHAVLDVFEHEPLAPTDSLWQHKKITVLPHISAPTNMISASDIVATNVKRYRTSGILPEFVDIKLGY